MSHRLGFGGGGAANLARRSNRTKREAALALQEPERPVAPIEKDPYEPRYVVGPEWRQPTEPLTEEDRRILREQTKPRQDKGATSHYSFRRGRNKLRPDTVNKFRPSTRRVVAERGAFPFKCPLCNDPLTAPLNKSIEAHRPLCARRQVVRHCGICACVLPSAYPLSVKYCRGACDAIAERQMWDRVRAGRWPDERAEPIRRLVAAGTSAGAIAQQFNLTVPTLQSYLKRWRARGFHIPRLTVFQREKPLPLVYPFINTTPTSDHDLVLLVDRAVPKSLPESIRADVCQQIVLDILEGHLTPETLTKEMPDIIKEIRRELEPYAVRSLETMRLDDSRDGYLDRHKTWETQEPQHLATGMACLICHKEVFSQADHQVCIVILEEQARGRDAQNLGRLYLKADEAALGRLPRRPPMRTHSREFRAETAHIAAEIRGRTLASPLPSPAEVC